MAVLLRVASAAGATRTKLPRPRQQSTLLWKRRRTRRSLRRSACVHRLLVRVRATQGGSRQIAALHGGAGFGEHNNSDTNKLKYHLRIQICPLIVNHRGRMNLGRSYDIALEHLFAAREAIAAKALEVDGLEAAVHNELAHGAAHSGSLLDI